MPTVTQLWPSSTHHGVGVNATAELVNPTNVSVNDSSTFATAAVSVGADLGSKYGFFGLDAVIPAGAVITKVQLQYQGKYVAATGNIVPLGHVRAVIGGSAQTDHTFVETTTLTLHTVDATADRAWVRSDLLDGTLEVDLEFTRSSGATPNTADANDLTVIVDYYIPVSDHVYVLGKAARRRPRRSKLVMSKPPVVIPPPKHRVTVEMDRAPAVLSRARGLRRRRPVLTRSRSVPTATPLIRRRVQVELNRESAKKALSRRNRPRILRPKIIVPALRRIVVETDRTAIAPTKRRLGRKQPLVLRAPTFATATPLVRRGVQVIRPNRGNAKAARARHGRLALRARSVPTATVLVRKRVVVVARRLRRRPRNILILRSFVAPRRPRAPVLAAARRRPTRRHIVILRSLVAPLRSRVPLISDRRTRPVARRRARILRAPVARVSGRPVAALVRRSRRAIVRRHVTAVRAPSVTTATALVRKGVQVISPNRGNPLVSRARRRLALVHNRSTPTVVTQRLRRPIVFHRATPVRRRRVVVARSFVQAIRTRKTLVVTTRRRRRPQRAIVLRSRSLALARRPRQVVTRIGRRIPPRHRRLSVSRPASWIFTPPIVQSVRGLVDLSDRAAGVALSTARHVSVGVAHRAVVVAVTARTWWTVGLSSRRSDVDLSDEE